MKRIVFRVIFGILIIFWIGIIFYFSSQTGTNSSSTSSRITSHIIRIFVSGYENKSIEEQQKIFTTVSHVLRKIGHVSEYALLAFFIYSFLVSFKNRKLFVFITIFSIFVCASLDELNQYFTNGRVAAFLDVIYDTLGAIIMVLIMNIIFNVIHIIKRKKIEV